MLAAGTQLGNYRIVNLIKRGGMGEVYLAEDVRLNKRQLAIKVIQSEPMLYPNPTESKEAERLFQREMEAIAKLDHPNILPLIDFGEEDKEGSHFSYMVMPLRLEGSLGDWLRKRGNAEPLRPEIVGNLVSQAARALTYAHTKGLVHQDVKPSNFLVRQQDDEPEQPDLLLADFGIVKLSENSKSSTNARGTLEYMSPEQLNGHAVPASDQYALAIMAYELLTGKVPFSGTPSQILFQQMQNVPKAPSEVNVALPKSLDGVILRALEKEPEKRFASPLAFAEAFRNALNSAQPWEKKTEYAPLSGDRFEEQKAILEKTQYASPRPQPETVPAWDQNKYRETLPPPPPPPVKNSPSGKILIGVLVVVLIVAGSLGISAFARQTSNGPSSNSTGSGQTGNGVDISATGTAQEIANTAATVGVNQSNANATATVQEENVNSTATVQAANQTNTDATAQAIQAQETAQAQGNINATATAQANTPTLVLNDSMSGNSNSNWDTNTNCFYDQYGRYEDYEGTTNTNYPCQARNTSFSDFSYEITMRALYDAGTTLIGQAGGLLFRSDGNTSYYAFLIYPNTGQYKLVVYSNGSPVNNLANGYSPAINQGEQSNLIVVTVKGETIGLFINNQLVAKVQDGSYSNGMIGVLAEAGTLKSSMAYTDARVWTYGS